MDTHSRQEVRQKEQSLRVLGKHLSGLQQEKKSLEESVRHAEDALRMSAKRKDSLASYMRAVESSYREVRDRIVQSRSTSTDKDLPLQLPRVHLDLTGPERLLGGPDVAACQVLVLYHAAFSRIGSMEREISAHQSHVSALRKELHDACLREDLCFIPVRDERDSIVTLNTILQLETLYSNTVLQLETLYSNTVLQLETLYSNTVLQLDSI
uniref:Uncharacterized protein n=1 Tax=Oncorhynchus mykiss TaxID=8022 RepID=A0A8K9XEK8_ONCMY